MGRLVAAVTGFEYYRHVRVPPDETPLPPPPTPEELELEWEIEVHREAGEGFLRGKSGAVVRGHPRENPSKGTSG